MHRPKNPIAWVFVAFLSFVVAVLGLSLVMASIGAGRLAGAMGYDPKAGYGRRHLRSWKRYPARSGAALLAATLAWLCSRFWGRLDLPRGTQRPRDALNRDHGHLYHRAQRHLEDGGPQ
jgi:hypothetical protein